LPSTVSNPPVDVPPLVPCPDGVLPALASAALPLADRGSSVPTGIVEPSLESDSDNGASGLGSIGLVSVELLTMVKIDSPDLT